MDPADTAYSMMSGLRLRGHLDHAVLRRAIDRVVARHESLRTCFREERGQLLQVVVDRVSAEFTVADLAEEVRRDGMAAVLRRVRAEAARPFDLTRVPLLRVLVLGLARHDQVVVFTMHHIVSDGWSVGVLLREVTEAYHAIIRGADTDLPELPVQYADYAVWQRDWLRGEVYQRQLAYWRDRLAGAPEEVLPPTDRPRPRRAGHRGARHRVRLDAELIARLRELGDAEGGSLFVALTAGLTALLHRYTGHTDVVIGTPIANRNRVELESLIGFLANTLVLRVDTAGEPGLRELLRRAAVTCLDAYQHQDLPFDALVEELRPPRSLDRHPLFQVMLVLQSAPLSWPRLSGLELEPFEIADGTAKFDLLVEAIPHGEELLIDLEYRTDLYDAGTIVNLANNFIALLSQATADPERPVCHLPLAPGCPEGAVGGDPTATLAGWLDEEFGVDRTILDRVDGPVEAMAAGGAAAVHVTPAGLAHLVELADTGRLDWPAAVRLVLCRDGALPRDVVDAYYSAIPCPLYSYHIPDPGVDLVLVQQCRPGFDWPWLPAGRPIGAAQPVILDQYGQPVPTGVWGQLAVSGPGRLATEGVARLRLDGSVQLADQRPHPGPPADRPDPEPERVPSATEQRLREVWLDLLDRADVGLQDGFFELGGHSLAATRLVARLREVFDVDLPVRAVFEHPTIAGLATVVDEAFLPTDRNATHRLPPLAPRIAEDAGFPLSFNQERLWFLSQLAPDTTAYTIAAGVWLTGWPDESALRASLDSVVRRHQVLRTSFIDDLGTPTQVVRPPTAVPWQVEDLRPAGGGVAGADAVAAVVRDHLARPFDLAGGPLVRPLLVRVAPLRWLLVLAVHHIAADGWSLGVLQAELAEEYAARVTGRPAELPPLPVQYADFATWQRATLTGAVLADQLAFWRRQLAGLVPLALPTDRPRPAVQTFRGALHAFTVPADLTRDVTQLAGRTGTSPFMVTLAVFHALLGRWCGERDVAVGVPVANRDRPELERLIGFFVNTLVLRARWDADTRFTELLDQVRGVSLDAQANQDVPFERLVEELRPPRDLSRSPLFQVAFALDNTPMADVVVPGLVLRPHRLAGEGARFDLTLFLRHAGDSLNAEIEFNIDLFERDTIDRFAGWYLRALAAVVADPGRAVADLLPPTPEETDRLWAADRNVIDLPETTVVALIDQQVRRTPDAVAVVDGERRLTYRDLDRCAARLARRLRAAGVGPESVVAVHTERSLELVVALLAVLKAGGAYLPVDTDLPAARISYLIDDARPALVLAQRDLAEQPPTGDVPVLWLTGVAAPEPQQDESAESEPLSPAGPDHLMYVIYTSGSTGRPKGALNTHRAVLNRLLWMQRRYRLDHRDVVLQKTPFGFDVSVWEFFWPLLSGARLVLAAPGGHRDPEYLADLINEQRVTTVHFVPSMLRVFLEADDLGRRCASLRRVVCSGEALSKDLERRFHHAVGHAVGAELHNLYGPTEAAIDVTAWQCSPSDGRPFVPIGRPIDNVTVHVLDERLRPVPPGMVGEIHLGGVGVCRGYLRRPGLTAERFLPDPFAARPGARMFRTGDLGRLLPDGAIAYLGRTDDQVKLRGVRIELGEIESVLAEHPAVHSAAARLVENAAGEPALVAYAVPDESTARPVRTWLRWTRDGTAAGLRRQLLPNGLPVVTSDSHGGSVEFLYDEIFVRREYIRHGVTLPEDAIVFDVGANIGMFTLFVHTACAHARIWAFEPIPASHELLLRNAELHGVNLRGWQCGLGARPGRATFTHYPTVSIVSGQYADPAQDRAAVAAYLRRRAGAEDHGLADQVAAEALRSERLTAPIRTLSEIIRADAVPRIDLLKIDVERAELDVLNGLDRADWPKVRQVVAEVHDIDGRVDQIRAMLTDLGFDVRVDRQDELGEVDLHTVYAVRAVPPRPAAPAPVPAPAAERSWSDAQALVGDLREQLRDRLPVAMLPSAVVLLPELPVSANGKLDRAALPPADPEPAEVRAVPPRDDLELQLVLLYRELLGLPEIGVTDDFFALGGHSLLGARLIARIRTATGRSVPLTALFQGATVERVASLLRGREPAAAGPGVVPLFPGDAGQFADDGRATVLLVHPAGGHLLGYRELSDRLAAGGRVYGLPDPGLAGGPQPAATGVGSEIGELARHHLDQLRRIGPARPWHLVGWSFGGVLAYELARQARAAGEPVGALIMLDPHLLSGEPTEVPADEALFAMFRDEVGVPGQPPGGPGWDVDRALAELLADARAAGLVPPGNVPDDVRRLWDVFRANVIALYRYHPQPYPGDAVLIRPVRVDHADPVPDPADSEARWAALFGPDRLTVRGVNGDHHSMVTGPAAADCVRIIHDAVAMAAATDPDRDPRKEAGA